MPAHDELLLSLLGGLPNEDQIRVLQVVNRTREKQIDRKLHPPRRRRRNADGVLVWPEDTGE